MRGSKLPRACFWVCLFAAVSLIAACEAAGPAPKSAGGAVAAQAGQPKPPTAERVQFNGTYRAVLHDPQGAEAGLEYLRFSTDGTLMSISTTAPLEAGVAPDND